MDYTVQHINSNYEHRLVGRGTPGPTYPTATAGIKVTGYPDLPVSRANNAEGSGTYAQLFERATASQHDATAAGDQYWKQTAPGWQ